MSTSAALGRPGPMYGRGDWVDIFRMERRRREVGVIAAVDVSADDGFVFDSFSDCLVCFREEDEEGASLASSSTIADAAPSSFSRSLLLLPLPPPPPKEISGLQPGGPTARRARVFSEGISRMILFAFDVRRSLWVQYRGRKASEGG